MENVQYEIVQYMGRYMVYDCKRKKYIDATGYAWNRIDLISYKDLCQSIEEADMWIPKVVRVYGKNVKEYR